jgi:tetratricopeptide (TPR) repeat protein
LRSSSVREALGDYQGGLADARGALALADALLAANPDDAISRSYTAQSWHRIALNEMGLGERARACAAYGRALESYQQVIAAGRADKSDRANLADAQARIASCAAQESKTDRRRPRRPGEVSGVQKDLSWPSCE